MLIFWQSQYFVAHQIKRIQKLWKSSMVMSHFQPSAWGAWRQSLFFSVTAKLSLEDLCPWSVQQNRKLSFIDRVSKLKSDCHLPKKKMFLFMSMTTFLFHVKSSFNSWDIYISVLIFWLYRKVTWQQNFHTLWCHRLDNK